MEGLFRKAASEGRLSVWNDNVLPDVQSWLRNHLITGITETHLNMLLNSY